MKSKITKILNWKCLELLKLQSKNSKLIVIVIYFIINIIKNGLFPVYLFLRHSKSFEICKILSIIALLKKRFLKSILNFKHSIKFISLSIFVRRTSLIWYWSRKQLLRAILYWQAWCSVWSKVQYWRLYFYL